MASDEKSAVKQIVSLIPKMPFLLLLLDFVFNFQKF